jgi:hypothetical protein
MYKLTISVVTDSERNGCVLQVTCKNGRERRVTVSMGDQGISHWQ